METVEYIQPNQRYAVWGGMVEYNGFLYSAGDEFTGVQGVAGYSGSGFVSEISGMQDAKLEVFRLDEAFVFTERLQMFDAALEVAHDNTNVVFPEQLQLYDAAVEVQEVVIKTGARIIYSKN